MPVSADDENDYLGGMDLLIGLGLYLHQLDLALLADPHEAHHGL